jgi:competence protein ComEC
MLKDGESLALRYGQNVDITAKIRYPRNFGNPDAFDYVAYLAQQHIYWIASAASPETVHLTPGSCGNVLLRPVYDVRTWALQRLATLYPNDPHTAALLQATLLGETAGVERRWTEDFRVTGTYHALVISGQHISIVAGTLLFLFTLLRVRRLPSLLVSTAATWFYAILTGMSSPAVRAAGGFTLFLLASMCFRKTRILNVLGAIGLVYLLFAPAELFDPSFQLSFLSAAAIGAFAVPAMERWSRPVRAAVKRFDQVSYDPRVEVRAAEWRVELRLLAETIHQWSGLPLEHAQSVVAVLARMYSAVADVVIVSACIQFGLALPMIAYFHRLSLTGLTANIVVIPLLLALIPIGFAAIVTGLPPLAWLTALLLHWSEVIAGWHAHFEPAWRMAGLPVGIAIAFSLSLILLGISIRRKHPLVITLSTAASLVLFFVICYQPWKPLVTQGWLEVSALDVSQGDSIFIAFPNGKTMLVDAGGFPGLERMARKPQIDMGEDVVSPYLWSRRIRHLDYVTLSHGHSDHMAGLAAVLDNFRPETLFVGPEPTSAEWQVVEQHAAADHVKIRSLHRGSPEWDIDSVHMRVLAPEPDYVAQDQAKNDDSLVLELTYGKRSVLLEGDAEFPSEAAMIASGELKPVTLLKVAHHGSKTSSGDDFLNLLQPQFAFISDGYHNQFHHPHPTTLAHLAEHNIAVFRTDEHGLVQFRTNGDKMEIRTYR